MVIANSPGSIIKHKFDVFHKFHDFQSLVARQFDQKILALQTNWG
jgi:hypothetical protein